MESTGLFILVGISMVKWTFVTLCDRADMCKRSNRLFISVVLHSCVHQTPNQEIRVNSIYRHHQCSLSSLVCRDLKLRMMSCRAALGLKDWSSTRYPQILSRHALVNLRLMRETEFEHQTNNVSKIRKTSGGQSALTCRRRVHGCGRPHILTEAHGCTRPGEEVFLSAANTGPTENPQIVLLFKRQRLPDK